MKIISWNVNGIQTRLDGISQLVEEYLPNLMCVQKISKIRSLSNEIPGYLGQLGIMDDELFGGVSTYIRQGFPFEFETQRNDMPEWLMNTGCLNVMRFDKFILVNTYFPYYNTCYEEWLMIRKQWDYERYTIIWRNYPYFYQNRLEYRIANQGFRIDYFMVSQELVVRHKTI